MNTFEFPLVTTTVVMEKVVCTETKLVGPVREFPSRVEELNPHFNKLTVCLRLSCCPMGNFKSLPGLLSEVHLPLSLPTLLLFPFPLTSSSISM